MKTIAIVIFDDFTDIDFFLMYDILNRPEKEWKVEILGTKSEHVSTLGLKILTSGHIRETKNADVVLFTSGKNGVPNALMNKEFMSSLYLDPSKQLLGSICAGSFFLQQLGLLSQQKATTNPDAFTAFEKMGANVEERAFIANGNIATAGGCLAQLYLTGWVAEKLVGREKRLQIHRQLLPAGQSELFNQIIEDSIAMAI